MGDRVRVQLPEAALYFDMQPTTQVDDALYKSTYTLPLRACLLTYLTLFLLCRSSEGLH